MQTVLRTTIIALVLGCNACVTVPSSWIVPEPQASPIEVAAQSGRVADSWSIVEYEEIGPDFIICPSIEISMFLANDSIWLGLSTGYWQQFEVSESGYDWVSVTEALKEFRETSNFEDRHDIQIAAADQVQYGDVVSAMDRAIETGFTQLSYVAPKYLHSDFTGLRVEIVR